MKRLLGVTAGIVAALWVPVRGRVTESPLQSAAVAWEHGDYVAALTTYLQVLNGPDADVALDTIAVQTGELYKATELTTNGAAPRFAPGGKFLTYETGAAASRTTRLLRADGSTVPLRELSGTGAVFRRTVPKSHT